jgi:hypothetical protein
MWRGDRVEDPAGRHDLGRVGFGHYRIWSDQLETHVSGSLQYNGPAPEEHVLGDSWVTLRPTDALRLDAGLGREQVMTQSALDLNILYWSASASLDWQATRRWSLHGSHRQNFYSDQARTWHTALAARDRLVSRRDWALTGGFEFEHLAADADYGHGYYAPRSYVEVGPSLGTSWESGGWSLEMAARSGFEREAGDGFHPYYGLEAHVEAPLGENASLSMEGARTDSHLGSASGFERTAATMYLTVRF